MKKYNFITLHFIFFLSLLLGFACEKNDKPVNHNPNPPTPPEYEEPESDNVLYNGIKLPTTWPPKRSYTSDLEKGMTPFYLTSKTDVINISVGRQLFVDNFLIENTNMTRTFYYPKYHPLNPILKADKDWEKINSKGSSFAAPFSDGVWYDEKDNKFKMWYMAGGGSYSKNNEFVTCYAESSDGINWEKPNQSVIDGTNIVDYNSERDASTVWIDKQETTDSKRYKMFNVIRTDGKWRYRYKTSIDGIRWRETESSKPIADRSTVYKNPFRNNWIYSIRHNIRVNQNKLIRARDYYESNDPTQGTKNAEALLSNFWFGPWEKEQKHPDYPEVSPAVYNHDAIAYESIILGFFNVWQGPENDIAASNNILKRNQIMVGYSRDGYSWLREDMNPFLPVNESISAWNNGNLQSAAGSPLIVNDKLYFYLSGRRLTPNNEEITTTGLATLRRDGFVSMKTEDLATLTTPKLSFNGEFFFINANISGKLWVELLDEKGEAIKGFSKKDCIEFTGDNSKQIIKWESNPTLKSLKGQKIKVKFYIENGEVFSFWISPYADGRSKGYTGGGGNGFDITGRDI